MKRIRMRTVAVFSLAGLTGALLLQTSQSVQKAEEKLAQLKAAIMQEQDSITMLNAEWAFLNNPERLEKLAGEYLDLMPPQPAAMIYEPDEIPAKFEETPSSAPSALASPQTIAFENSSSDTSKPSEKDLKALLKKVGKAGTP